MGIDEERAESFGADRTEMQLCGHDASYCGNVEEEDDYISAGEKA